MDTNEKTQKSSDKFFCSACDYNTHHKHDYARHLLTLKHKLLTNTNKKPQKTQDDKSFKCACGNSYKFASSLCYHALNISDFIQSLEITLDDLMYSKNKGLVEGITNVMIKGLRQLDIYKRPIHCTDTKRETMYIKNCEKWEKDENHEKMKNTILKIANKERNMISAWVEENPNWFDTEESQIEYLTMVRNVCEPIENDERSEKKIIRNISREVFLDKSKKEQIRK